MKYIWLILCFLCLFISIDLLRSAMYLPGIAFGLGAVLMFTFYIQTPKGY